MSKLERTWNICLAFALIGGAVYAAYLNQAVFTGELAVLGGMHLGWVMGR